MILFWNLDRDDGILANLMLQENPNPEYKPPEEEPEFNRLDLLAQTAFKMLRDGV